MRKKKAIDFAIALITTAFVTAGCGGGSSKSGKPVIAVSIVPQEAFVRQIAGEYFDIVTLVPPGHSPENYQPTPMLMQKLSKAKIYFAIGIPTEQSSILPELSELSSDVKVVDLSGIVSEIYPPLYFEHGHTHEAGESGQEGNATGSKSGEESKAEGEDKGMPDPHIWLSPKRVIVMIQAIADELSQIDPEHKSVFDKNASEYILQLEQLDENIKSALEGLPSRSFFIYHPSFAYFADDYDLEMISLEQEGKSATAASLQGMADIAEAKNIRVILYQAENSSRQTEAFAEEIGGTAVEVDPLSADYIANMQKIAQIFRDVLK